MGCTAHINVDWAPVGRRMLRDAKIMASVRAGDPIVNDWYASVSKPLRVKAHCTIGGTGPLGHFPWYPGFFVEYFVHEVFLIANLACPGAASFFRLTIEQSESRLTWEPRLSAYDFDEWMIETQSGAHPGALVLDTRRTVAWLRQVIPGVTQKAETPTQRALYALYQLAKGEGYVDTVLWIFHGLESLLSTRVGENVSGLSRRITLVLQLNSKQEQFMKKQLRSLYDLRSSFVHGGFDTPHPMASELIDPRLDEHYEKFREPCRYGFSLLAALLQKMIQDGRRTLVFEERLANEEGAI
jgi:hypothetical protein